MLMDSGMLRKVTLFTVAFAFPPGGVVLVLYGFLRLAIARICVERRQPQFQLN